MKIGEKFEKIADAVYKKGVSDFGVSFDETGTNLVTIKNVHPKEHDVEVLSDAESVTVCGKNFFNIDDGLAKATTQNSFRSLSKNADGTYTISKLETGSRSSDVIPLDVPSGTQITLSVDIKGFLNSDLIVLFTDDTNTSVKEVRLYTSNNVRKHTFTANSHIVGSRIMLLYSSTVGDYVTFENFQLEYGDTVTDFEEFKSSVTYPVADGKVIVKSVSPTMNITTPESGVSINAKGYLDGQAVIDELTQAIVDIGGEI